MKEEFIKIKYTNKTNILLIILTLSSLILSTLSVNQTLQEQNNIQSNIPTNNNKTLNISEKYDFSNLTTATILNNPELHNNETFQANLLLNHSYIASNIEKNLNETFKDENTENIDKYKEFNITYELEQNYSDYEEDKTSDYFNNIDNLNDDLKKNKKLEKDLVEEKYNQEWDQKVSKINAHDILTLKIKKREYEFLYEIIETVPVNITCAYYSHYEKSKIDFDVFNHKRIKIFKLKSKNKGFFEFTATEPGRYEFRLSNQKVKKKILFLVSKISYINFCLS